MTDSELPTAWFVGTARTSLNRNTSTLLNNWTAEAYDSR